MTNARRGVTATTRPNVLRNLVEKTGGLTPAAEKVGLTYSTLHKYMKENKCPLVAEIAAEAALFKLSGRITEKPVRREVLMIQVPQDKVSLFTDFTKAIDVRATRFKDE